MRQGLITELIEYNLKRGSAQVRQEVRALLCLLTKDNSSATEALNQQLTRRIVTAMRGFMANSDFVSEKPSFSSSNARSFQRVRSCK